MFSNNDIIGKVNSYINDINPDILLRMKTSRPTEVHEKAHAYPVSVPQIWSESDENIINWDFQVDKPLRLYIHIPWCKLKCVFCFYESDKCIPSDETVKQYISSLECELKLYLARLGIKKFKAEVLYIGGGTPSVLNATQINILLDMVHQYVDFTNESSLITEISPGTITPEKIKAFASGGINRISMGVQSFQDHILKKCNRDHNSEEAVIAYTHLREAGILEINFDLMLALPDQTYEDFSKTVLTALELGPSSISFLDLRVAAGSYLHELGYYYPSWEEDIMMRAIYQEMMKMDGRYMRTRPHYYILPEEARGRSTRVPCLDSRIGLGFQIGIGVTSYGHLGNVQYCNMRNPSYTGALNDNILPISSGLILSEEDKIAMKAIRSIVDYKLVPSNKDILSQYKKEIKYLTKNNLIDKEYQLTNEGCLFGEEIAYMFYPQKALI